MNHTHLDQEQLLLLLIKYMKENKRSEFRKLLQELQPYDIAELYKTLPVKHHHKFISLCTPEQIALLLQELDRELQSEILQKLGVEQSSKIMDLMENDDLADLLSELSVETSMLI